MRIEMILRSKGNAVFTARPDTTMEELVATMTGQRIGALLVMQGDEVVGVVSERDIVRGLAGHMADVLRLKARDIMTEVVAICPGDTAAIAMGVMNDRRIRHLPVIDSGRLVGLVSIGDLVKQRIGEIEREAEALKDYIATG